MVAIPLSCHTSDHHPSVLPPSIPLQLIWSPASPNSLILSYLLPSLLFASSSPPPPLSLPVSITFCSLEVWLPSPCQCFPIHPFLFHLVSSVSISRSDSLADLLSQKLWSLLFFHILKGIYFLLFPLTPPQLCFYDRWPFVLTSPVLASRSFTWHSLLHSVITPLQPTV